MRTEIIGRLLEIESKYDVRILLAVESGSRAWGFASKDSDYDVRFVYLQRMDKYLSLTTERDVIEELDPDGVLDLVGWDLRKALFLMAKGNCAFAEWLSSPFAYYRNMYFFESIINFKDDYFRKVAAVNHYYHMAMNHDKRYLDKKGCQLKRFLYHLRGLLAAKYAAVHGTYPPVLFFRLVEATVDNKDIKAEIDKLVKIKSESRENNTMIVSDTLVDYAANLASEIESMLGTLPKDEPRNYKALGDYFVNLVKSANF